MSQNQATVLSKVEFLNFHYLELTVDESLNVQFKW